MSPILSISTRVSHESPPVRCSRDYPDELGIQHLLSRLLLGPLFAFMVVVGSMNIVWMALITAVLSLERVVPWGERLTRVTDIVVGIAGVAIVVISVI